MDTRLTAPGPRDLTEWRRQRVADLNARFPGWHTWRDDDAGTYRSARKDIPPPGSDAVAALENPDVHLLGVHLKVASEIPVPPLP